MNRSCGQLDNTPEENGDTLARAHEEAEAWARTHAAIFAPVKYELMHLTNRPKKYPITETAMLTLPGREVEPGISGCLLGLYLDPQRQWGSKLNHIQISVTKRFGALQSLARTTCGNHHSRVAQALHHYSTPSGALLLLRLVQPGKWQPFERFHIQDLEETQLFKTAERRYVREPPERRLAQP